MESGDAAAIALVSFALIAVVHIRRRHTAPPTKFMHSSSSRRGSVTRRSQSGSRSRSPRDQAPAMSFKFGCLQVGPRVHRATLVPMLPGPGHVPAMGSNCQGGGHGVAEGAAIRSGVHGGAVGDPGAHHGPDEVGHPVGHLPAPRTQPRVRGGAVMRRDGQSRT